MKLGESPLAALSKLSLLDDVARGTFFVAIVSQLCVPPLPVVAAESMQTEFGLDFTNGEPENLERFFCPFGNPFGILYFD